MLHADAKHPNCAYKWMEWSLDPKVQGDVAYWFGSVPVVPAACDGNELLGPDGCTVNGIDELRPASRSGRRPRPTASVTGASASPTTSG